LRNKGGTTMKTRKRTGTGLEKVKADSQTRRTAKKTKTSGGTVST